MAYHGSRLRDVPLANIFGLEFSWPLAEARAGALVMLVAEAVSQSESEGIPLEKFSFGMAGEVSWFCHMLRNIDTAIDCSAILECVQLLGGSKSVQGCISSRQQMVTALQELRDRVQGQWIRQMHCLTAESSEALEQRILADRPGFSTILEQADSYKPHWQGGNSWVHCCQATSRHVVQSWGQLSGETLASMSLLYGDGKSALHPEPLPLEVDKADESDATPESEV